MWRLIPREWQEVILPRKLYEEIEGEDTYYSDVIWIPSATDMFGNKNGEDTWWEEESDSFQLPIFMKSSDRAKSWSWNNKASAYWTRSICSYDTINFCIVDTDGEDTVEKANAEKLGIVLGFDVGSMRITV